MLDCFVFWVISIYFRVDDLDWTYDKHKGSNMLVIEYVQIIILNNNVKDEQENWLIMITVKSDFYIFRSFRPPLAEDEDWYDPMLNPFSDNNYTESEGDDHYETIDDVQLAVAELQRQEQQRSDSHKSKNMPKVNIKENRTSSGYAKIGGASQKVRPPRPKRPASIISAERQEATSVETLTSFDQDESKSAEIPKIVISEKEQTKPSEEEGKT